jgi:hypothetical protein
MPPLRVCEQDHDRRQADNSGSALVRLYLTSVRLATGTREKPRQPEARGDLVVVRDRTPVCRAGKTICELLDQCPC